MIENNNLSADGFLLTPQPAADAIMPELGDAFCTEKNFAYSPPPVIIGSVPNLDKFGAGQDIDVHGIVVKRHNCDEIFIPLELEPFLPTLAMCIANEYGLSYADAHKRQFSLTITRSNIVPGRAHRIIAGPWHTHSPCDRTDHAAKVQATRSYTVADRWGTECYVGTRQSFQSGRDVSTTSIKTIANGQICAFSSMTIHRSPTLDCEGRRTVLIFSSRAQGNQDPIYSNPMHLKLLDLDATSRVGVLAVWKTACQKALANISPRLPHDALRDTRLLSQTL